MAKVNVLELGVVFDPGSQTYLLKEGVDILKCC